MEIKTFKKIVNDALFECGFVKNGTYYHLESDDVLSVIGMQKSNYSNGYYINVGFLLKEFVAPGKKPRDVDGDIRTRINYYNSDTKTDFFDLEIIEESDGEKLKNVLKDYISQNVIGATTKKGLKELLEKRPALLNKTTLNAKRVLGL